MSPTESCTIAVEECILSKSPEDRIFDIVFKEDDLSWKEMIYDLVKSENMDPWNINISILAEKFIDMIKKFKTMDFRIGGKIILASSLLLKLKSDRLVGEDIDNFNKLLAPPTDEEDMFIDDGFEFEQTDLNSFLNSNRKLVPRTPQPRERKVSVFDLVNVLEQALEADVVKQRKKLLRQMDLNEEIDEVPKKHFELTKTMEELHKKLAKLFVKTTTKVYFNELLTSQDKQCKVYTFLPLLHLENQRKVEMSQEEHFGEIEVKIMNKEFI
ncbi:MAG: segregation/condensation protein A [Candidatus Woesearchaeota archaeon]